MSGPLTINQSSPPHWWLSHDIWVTPVGVPNNPPGVLLPIVGIAYDVSVNVHNNHNSPVNGDWNLWVCWAIPTAGPIPIAAVSGQILNNGPISVLANSTVTFKTAQTWTPSFLNGGHECLIAVTFVQGMGFPFPSLNGDAAPTADYSIAQHNLGVLAVGSEMMWRFHYAFQVCNGTDEERRFVVAARQAPLSEIAVFLPGVPGGRTVIDRPGKVERIGIVASDRPNPAELEAATAVLSPVRIAPHSCWAFTLGGSLQEGNALIHVTQSLDERVVGGLSVLVMAEEK
jgi:hypothetical protein